MKFSKVQMAAYELIQSDARFLYALTVISRNARNIDSNYIMMSQPYIGIFTDGAEQWCHKVGLKAPAFNESEKAYYSALRQGHKLFRKSYDDYMTLLIERLNESDKYFYNIRSLRERILGYYNVGVDICDGAFCGNTIIGAMYAPMKLFETPNIGIWLRNMSVISGKIAATFNCAHFPVYKYDDELVVTYKDFHFFKNCPLKKQISDFCYFRFFVVSTM